jgi:hypothetical protein
MSGKKPNDIVTALTYAAPGPDESGEALIRVSPDLELARKNEDYAKRLEGVDTQSLIDLQFKFSDNLPYLKLCSDERIREYFAQWNLPIESRTDLELFSQTLAERITTLARDDSGARRYVKQREYGAQLAKLPQEISDFSKEISDFKFLEKPLEALVKLAFDSAIDHGFVMNENGEDAIEKYEGKIKIMKYCEGAVEVELTTSDSSLNFFIIPAMCKRTEKKGFFSLKREIYEYPKGEYIIVPAKLLDVNYDKFEIGHFLQHVYHGYERETYYSRVSRTHIGGYISLIRQKVLENPKKFIPSIIELSRLILHFPAYVQNYARKTVSEFGEAVQMMKSE